MENKIINFADVSENVKKNAMEKFDGLDMVHSFITDMESQCEDLEDIMETAIGNIKEICQEIGIRDTGIVLSRSYAENLIDVVSSAYTGGYVPPEDIVLKFHKTSGKYTYIFLFFGSDLDENGDVEYSIQLSRKTMDGKMEQYYFDQRQWNEIPNLTFPEDVSHQADYQLDEKLAKILKEDNYKSDILEGFLTAYTSNEPGLPTYGQFQRFQQKNLPVYKVYAHARRITQPYVALVNGEYKLFLVPDDCSVYGPRVSSEGEKIWFEASITQEDFFDVAADAEEIGEDEGILLEESVGFYKRMFSMSSPEDASRYLWRMLDHYYGWDSDTCIIPVTSKEYVLSRNLRKWNWNCNASEEAKTAFKKISGKISALCMEYRREIRNQRSM